MDSEGRRSINTGISVCEAGEEVAAEKDL